MFHNVYCDDVSTKFKYTAPQTFTVSSFWDLKYLHTLEIILKDKHKENYVTKMFKSDTANLMAVDTEQ